MEDNSSQVDLFDLLLFNICDKVFKNGLYVGPQDIHVLAGEGGEHGFPSSDLFRALAQRYHVDFHSRVEDHVHLRGFIVKLVIP